MIREVAIMSALTLFLLVIGYVVGVFLGIDPTFTTLFALIIAVTMNFATYFFSDKIVLRMSHARLVSEQEEPRLHRIVAMMAIKAGIPKPKVAVVPTDVPNAFATGRNPQNAVVAATTGLLRILDENEIEGVLAHEVSHVMHRDTLISAMAATIAGAIGYVAWFGQMSVFYGGGRRDSRQGGNSILALLAFLFVPIASMFLQLAISRSREYKADEAGAKISMQPLSLASALSKIENYVQHRPLQGVSPSTSALWVVNPFRGQGLTELFSTHPATSKRIRRLQQIAQSGP